ncbi:MAG TPA: PIN domain-containing protein [Acidimicrobiales bacterium]|nr:PIN domain-containing protein [Acidimicrobiales bacterium]
MLLLDSEAISAFAHGPDSRRDRVRALMVQMRRRDLPIGTAGAVLAEVIRGRPSDAGVFSGLRRERVQVYPIDSQVGVRAGELLGQSGRSSADAVDAFLVAVADLRGGAVIATVDVDDIGRFAVLASGVQVADIAGSA